MECGGIIQTLYGNPLLSKVEQNSRFGSTFDKGGFNFYQQILLWQLV